MEKMERLACHLSSLCSLFHFSALSLLATRKRTRWNKWNDTSREVYEMFKTEDTGALKQDKKCQPCWYIILSTMSGSTTIKELKKITYKPLFFCWALPHGVMDSPPLHALVSPSQKDNVIYDGHAYPPSLSRILYFRSISLLMKNIPLYMGEFNAGFTNGTDLTQIQIYEYIDRFKSFST